jgi:short-subunit dehydrogenase
MLVLVARNEEALRDIVQEINPSGGDAMDATAEV